MTGIMQMILSGPFGAAPFNFTISSNQTNANLRSLAISAGWTGTGLVTATVGSGVYVYSTSIGTPGLTINGSFPDGVALINNGYIMGQGGNGAGGPGYGPQTGGNAISLGVNCTITNNSYIGGGGGGGGPEFYNNGQGGGGAGGGGGGNYGAPSGPSGYQSNGGGAGSSGSPSPLSFYTPPYKGVPGYTTYYGGGGGGRIMPGTGGSAGRGSNGGPGSTPAGGGGAGGGANSNSFSSPGGAGGSAGNPGSPYPSGQGGGGGGGWGAPGGTGRNGGGGGGGKAIALNGYTANILVTGTIYGAVS